MAITLSHADYLSWLSDSATDACTDDDTEWVYVYPPNFGQGRQRLIALQDGLDLSIEEVCLNQDLEVRQPDRPHPLEYGFELIENGHHSHQHFALYGSGLAPAGLWCVPGQHRVVSVNVHIEPALFQRWVGIAACEEPPLWICCAPLTSPIWSALVLLRWPCRWPCNNFCTVRFRG